MSLFGNKSWTALYECVTLWRICMTIEMSFITENRIWIFIFIFMFCWLVQGLPYNSFSSFFGPINDVNFVITNDRNCCWRIKSTQFMVNFKMYRCIFVWLHYLHANLIGPKQPSLECDGNQIWLTAVNKTKDRV